VLALVAVATFIVFRRQVKDDARLEEIQRRQLEMQERQAVALVASSEQ
jgi:hypothetical protein